MTPAPVTSIAVGDIFLWRYKSPELNSNYLSYWAKSCIAVAVADGVLRDTYWTCNDNTHWTFTDAIARLDLTYLGNFAGLDKISEDEATYYTEADIVNLNHGNSPKGNCYRRKGTERNRQVMLDKLDYEVEKAKSEIRSSQRTIDRLTETRATIQSGADLTGIWI